MRRQTELSSNIRGMALSPRGWGDKVHDSAIGGGNNKMMPNALAVLAASEARFMFWLIKLSGAWKEPDDEQARSAGVIGDHPQAEP